MYCVMKDVRLVLTVRGVDYDVNVSMAVSVIVLTAHVPVHQAGKVLRVIDLAMLDTSDLTVSTGLYCTALCLSAECRTKASSGPSRRSTVAPLPVGWSVCLQRLAGTDPVSLRSWSVQRVRGRPGRRLQSLPSERPDGRPTWQCRALCAGVP